MFSHHQTSFLLQKIGTTTEIYIEASFRQRVRNFGKFSPKWDVSIIPTTPCILLRAQGTQQKSNQKEYEGTEDISETKAL